MRIARLAIVTTLTTLACSSETQAPAVTDSGTAADSSPRDTATSDTAAPPVDTGMTTTPPATDLSFNAGFIGKGGPHFITGTLSLPSGAASGRAVQIEVIRKGSGNQVGLGGMTSASGTMTYKVTGLQAADYQIGVRVDADGNGMVNGSGDYIGYAHGTVASPKLTSAAADTITVAAPVSGVDLGLGVVP